MKNYIITVNGISYEVAVEEVGAGSGSVQTNPAPVKMPQPKTITEPTVKSAPKAPGVQGSTLIKAPMPGKILNVKADAGTAVNKGDVILVLEAMKMENEIVAPEEGTIASIEVAVGDVVEPNMILATLN